MRLLVVEDDRRLRRAFAGRLRSEGYAVDRRATFADAGLAIGSVECDCLLLDRKLPDEDSLSLVSELRQRSKLVPVIIVSSLGGVDDRITSLEPARTTTTPSRFGSTSWCCGSTRSCCAVRPGAPSIVNRLRPQVVGRITLRQRPREVDVAGHLRAPADAVPPARVPRCPEGRGRPVRRAARGVLGPQPEADPEGRHAPISRLRRILATEISISVVAGVGYRLDVRPDPP